MNRDNSVPHSIHKKSQHKNIIYKHLTKNSCSTSNITQLGLQTGPHHMVLIVSLVNPSPLETLYLITFL